MNKHILLYSLPFFLVLASCSPASSSEGGSSIEDKTQLETALNTLKDGYNIEYIAKQANKVVGGSGSVTTYQSYHNSMASEDIYRHIAYKETTGNKPTKDTVSSDETYQNDDGYTIFSALNYENKIITTPVKKEYKEVTWKASHYGNLFASLTKDDFSKDGSTYTLKSDLKASTNADIVAQLSGALTNGVSVSSFSMSFADDGSISFKASYQPYSIIYLTEIEVSESFEGKILTLGAKVNPPAPIEKEEDEAFSKAFEKLAALNFKTTVVNSEIRYKDGRYEEVATATSTVTSDSFAYTIYDENNKITGDRVYYSSNDKIQKAAKYDSDLYACGKPANTKISSYWPSFTVSSVFFNKENNKYTLKKEYARFFNSTYLFTPLVNDKIGDLSITIEDDRVTIENENEGDGRKVFGAKEEIVYEGFGTQKAIDTSSVKMDSSSLTWDKAIRSASKYKDLITAIGGKAFLDKIPYFGGLYSEAGYEDDSLYAFPFLYTWIDSTSDGEELVKKYAKELVDNGFTANTSKDDDVITYSLTMEGKTLEVLPSYNQVVDALTGVSTGQFYFAIAFSLTNSK